MILSMAEPLQRTNTVAVEMRLGATVVSTAKNPRYPVTSVDSLTGLSL